MKKLLLCVCFLTAIFYSGFITAQETFNGKWIDGLIWNAVPIKGHSNSGKDKKGGSVPLSFAQVYIHEKTLLIEFSVPVDVAAITVTDANSGEVVYAANATNGERFWVKLDEIDLGLYQLRVNVNNMILYGEFLF